MITFNLHVIDDIWKLCKFHLLVYFFRPVSDADIQLLERRLMQTMDMIVMKKKRLDLDILYFPVYNPACYFFFIRELGVGYRMNKDYI